MLATSPPARILSPGGLEASGGTIYNERIATHWATTVECVPGGWPFPDDADRDCLRQALLASSADRRTPVLIDGLIGCAAAQEVNDARAAGLRVVILVHLPLPAETGWTPAQQRQLAASEAAALDSASGVACTSAWAARDLGRRYGVNDVAVAEPGVDQRRVATGGRPIQLITPASYTPRKNHRLLVEALAAPVLADLEWQALWLGADPCGFGRERLGDEVTAAGLTDRVTLSPARSGTDLDEVWARSDLLLLPSVAETYAMVVSEAMASGIPAIVGARTAAEETLRGGVSLQGSTDLTHRLGVPGAALATDDPASWAETVARWLTSEPLREEWRSAALVRRDHLPAWNVPAGILADLMSAL